MSSMQEDIQCAGSDTRPPMLDRTDFESWQQRIRLYCLGKDNGENIMKSIKEGPFQMGTVSDVVTGGTEGAVQQGPVRARVLNDLSAEEKERYKADIRATNILLQGIPKDIYSLINHYTDAKDIWENVKMILEGSELTKDDRESQLYDEFEHFRQIKGENIQGYYVRFTKLINDMRNIKMTILEFYLANGRDTSIGSTSFLPSVLLSMIIVTIVGVAVVVVAAGAVVESSSVIKLSFVVTRYLHWSMLSYLIH
ncbi:hypothetical protein Tco_0580786 [Tanacetum coccineum]